MVRINIINPKFLSDQHLIAEYNEILMLLGYIRKHPKTDYLKIPKNYQLGKGHILFFKNKLKYIEKRFNSIKKEMKKRGFSGKIKINLNKFNKKLINNWTPRYKDINIIKERLIKKINLKPEYYRYYKKNKTKNFFIRLIKNAK
jgi:deoxyribonuclease (pyrimidine dimer)